MKKLIPLLLALCLLLCACGAPAEPTEEATTQPPQTTAPTTAPTAASTEAPTTEPPTEPSTESPTEPPVLHRNPLNGQLLDAPYVGRAFAVVINNIQPAIPHRGIGQSDIYYEMFVNHFATRGLAVFSDVQQVPSIGSIRSTRFNFTDLALAYNMVICHASAGEGVLNDMYREGVDNLLADKPIGYRDNVRYKEQGYAWEHTLFATGPSLWEAAQNSGFNLAVSDKDYGMTFEDVSSAAAGETANTVQIVFDHKGHTKETAMIYDPASNSYIYHQFGEDMVDENTGELVTFRNVIVMLTTVSDVKDHGTIYHVAELYGSGTGYFACDGKVIPILWSHEGEAEPIRFTLEDGTPLVQGVGSTFVAIAPKDSPVNIS